MQKWMRDRMRRRKKKPQTEANAAAEQNPPLQPVYPDSPEIPTGVKEEGAGAAEVALPSPAAEALPPAAPAKRPRRRKKKPSAAEPEQAPVAAADDAPEPEIVSAETDEAPAPIGEVPEPVAAPSRPAAVTEVHPSPPPVVAAQPAQPQRQGRPPKGAVVLAVGLPGSGKSTWFKRRGVSSLSSDMVRHVLFDNPTEQRFQDLVFGTLRSLLRARLIARMPMNYVDATNLSPKERRHWIKMAKDFGYEVHAVYFDVPLEVCMDRNRRRGRVVPDDVMHRMSAKLRPPTFDEGFTKIIVVRVKQKSGDSGADHQENVAATAEDGATE